MRVTIGLVAALALTVGLAACGDAGTANEISPEDTQAPVAENGGPETAVTAEPPEDAAAEAAAPAVEEAPTQSVACQTGEATLFSCSAAGGKTIAVCGKDGNAQYRFGGSSAEITLDKGKFASVPYSGGGEAQIAFTNGNTSYIVFSRTVRTNFTAGEPNNPEFTDGVAVVKGGNVIAERLCTGEAETVDVMAGENYGGVADELFFEG